FKSADSRHFRHISALCRAQIGILQTFFGLFWHRPGMCHQFFERMQRAIGNKQQLVTHALNTSF
ncbi:hypothetical protein J6Z39_01390, partial [bacterium]|nr:hypothetical protein [bacterium]